MQSIRSRLVKYFFTTVVVALVVLATVVYMLTSIAVFEREQEAMNVDANLIAQFFEKSIINEFETLEVIARNDIFKANKSSMDEKLSYLMTEQVINAYTVMDYVDTDGNAYLTSGQIIDVSDRAYFKKALAGERAISDIIISKADGTLIFVYAVPIFENNEVTGIVVAVGDASKLSEYLASSDRYEHAKSIVVEPSGKIVASTDVNDVFEERTINDIIKVKEIKSVDELDKLEMRQDTFKNSDTILAHEKIQATDWTVIISVPRKEILAFFNEPRDGFLLVSGLIILLSYISIVYIGGKIANPIRRLAANVELLKKSMFEGGVEENLRNEKSEVGFLSRNIHDLVEVKRRNFLEIRSQKEEIEALYEETAALNDELEYLFDQRNSLSEEIITTQRELLFTLGGVVEAKSQETGDHVERVSVIGHRLAKMVGMREEGAELLRSAAPMHDIGKIGVPDAILNKPGKLTPEEYDVIKQHTIYGASILSKSDRPLFKVAKEIALEHHERWDGKGYPNGLMRNDISLNARIVAIADVFDSLASKRCYKEPWDYDRIKVYFTEQRGLQFDPLLTDLLIENFEDFIALREGIGEENVKIEHITVEN